MKSAIEILGELLRATEAIPAGIIWVRMDSKSSTIIIHHICGTLTEELSIDQQALICGPNPFAKIQSIISGMDKKMRDRIHDDATAYRPR